MDRINSLNKIVIVVKLYKIRLLKTVKEHSILDMMLFKTKHH